MVGPDSAEDHLARTSRSPSSSRIVTERRVRRSTEAGDVVGVLAPRQRVIHVGHGRAGVAAGVRGQEDVDIRPWIAVEVYHFLLIVTVSPIAAGYRGTNPVDENLPRVSVERRAGTVRSTTTARLASASVAKYFAATALDVGLECGSAGRRRHISAGERKALTVFFALRGFGLVDNCVLVVSYGGVIVRCEPVDCCETGIDGSAECGAAVVQEQDAEPPADVAGGGLRRGCDWHYGRHWRASPSGNDEASISRRQLHTLSPSDGVAVGDARAGRGCSGQGTGHRSSFRR